jgi:hypothetical protein
VAISSLTKLNPDSVAHSRPGSGSGLAKDPGDKDEVHTSEEELGVTTPRTSNATGSTKSTTTSTKTKGGISDPPPTPTSRPTHRQQAP